MNIQTPPGCSIQQACRGVFLAAAVLLAVGCVSPRDIRVLQAQLDELQNEQHRISADLARLDSLNSGGSESQRDVMADLKASVGDMDARFNQVEARLTDLEGRLSAPGGSETPVVLPTVGGPGAGSQVDAAALDVYQTALEALKHDDHPSAITGFREYLKAAPDGSEAASAHFWIGESFFALGKSDSALVEYQAVVDRYPQSAKVPAALLKSGNIYQVKGDKEKAYPYFRRLKEEFPQSLEYQQLKKQLGQ